MARAPQSTRLDGIARRRMTAGNQRSGRRGRGFNPATPTQEVAGQRLLSDQVSSLPYFRCPILRAKWEPISKSHPIAGDARFVTPATSQPCRSSPPAHRRQRPNTASRHRHTTLRWSLPSACSPTTRPTASQRVTDPTRWLGPATSAVLVPSLLLVQGRRRPLQRDAGGSVMRQGVDRVRSWYSWAQSPYGVSATAQSTAVAVGSSRPRRYVGGFLPYGASAWRGGQLALGGLTDEFARGAGLYADCRLTGG